MFQILRILVQMIQFIFFVKNLWFHFIKIWIINYNDCNDTLKIKRKYEIAFHLFNFFAWKEEQNKSFDEILPNFSLIKSNFYAFKWNKKVKNFMIEAETLIFKMNSVPFEEGWIFIKKVIKDILNSDDLSFFLKWNQLKIWLNFFIENTRMFMKVFSYLYSFSFDDIKFVEILESILI
jgi:hypothetical protein